MGECTVALAQEEAGSRREIAQLPYRDLTCSPGHLYTTKNFQGGELKAKVSVV